MISIDTTGRQTNKRKPLSAAAALLGGHRRNVLELAEIPAARQDVTMFGTFPVGWDGNGGTCHFWHIARRHLSESDPLGVRVTGIKTNLGLSAADQASLAQAAARLVAQGHEDMTHAASWTGLMESPPALLSKP